MILATYRASDLIFTVEPHEYRFPNGYRVPNVTEILRAVGVSEDFDEIGSRSSVLREQIALKRQIGTAVHADCHAFDDNDLDWTTVDPLVRPYVDAWRTFRENTNLTPLTRERRVFQPQFNYCGTLDGIFRMTTGSRVLIDIKTGDPASAGAQYQTALYELAYNGEHPAEPVYERWSVQLTPELAVPYRVDPHTDWEDFAKAKAFVTTYWCQAARRRAQT